MTTSTGLWSALIAAAVAVTVAVLTQIWTSRRDKRGRTEGQRHAALRDAQAAALELRNALAAFGPLARRLGGDAEDLLSAQSRVEAAFAALDVMMTRVDDRDVVDGVSGWRDRARFHYVSAEEVTTAEEHALWTAMNERFGRALRELR
jgi:hypothetical protein